jgi:hypothetical protein
MSMKGKERMEQHAAQALVAGDVHTPERSQFAVIIHALRELFRAVQVEHWMLNKMNVNVERWMWGIERQEEGRSPVTRVRTCGSCTAPEAPNAPFVLTIVACWQERCLASFVLFTRVIAYLNLK